MRTQLSSQSRRTGFAHAVAMLCAVLAAAMTLLGVGDAWAGCDTSGLCCAGADVYVCDSSGGANTAVTPTYCGNLGCGYVNEKAKTACVSTGTVDWAKTSFCKNYCQAGCTGPACPGACQPGTQCVNGVCSEQACGRVADWRSSVWSEFSKGKSLIPPPSSGLRAQCSTKYWSCGIRQDGTLVYWGVEWGVKNLFANPLNSAIKDAVQVACSIYHVTVLRADGTVVSMGEVDGIPEPKMPAGLTGIRAIAATETATGVLKSDGTIVLWGSTFATTDQSGKSYQSYFSDAKGALSYVALSAGGVGDAGFAAIRSDGAVVLAGRKYDFGPWLTPPASSKGAVAVALGLEAAMVLKTDGSVVVWDQSNTVVPNPAGLKQAVAVAVGLTGSPMALQVDGTVKVWPIGSANPLAASLAQEAAKLTNVTLLDTYGMGALYCAGKCGAVSDTGCCLGSKRYWCDYAGQVQSQACASGTCGWHSGGGHFCDTNCGGPGAGCYCDASCTQYGDCCNAAGNGKAGNACTGSTCGSCNGGSAPLTPNKYQCSTSGGPAPGDGQVPMQSCICVPDCTGKQCGSDGCGGSCDKGSCDDNNLCTLTDKCAGDSCAGTPLSCDDANPCTTDACSVVAGKAGCTKVANTAVCTDGNACTVGDICANGACNPGSKALTCDDANPCTTDACDPKSGCVFTNNTTPCSDGNVCTGGDACSGGKCSAGSQATDCNDANPCTDDTCDPKAGCQTKPNTAACDDKSSCTGGDTCKSGKCAGTGTLNCDDGNPCTQDDCKDATTCAAKVSINEGGKCSDGNACNLGGTCATGTCGKFTKLDCNDGNPCTDDVCDPKVGCTAIANAAPCSDGNACTAGDTCKNSSCGAGLPLASCDDGNPCTDDCDPSSGCVKKNNTLPCNDNSLCTTVDSCSGGACIGGQPKSCDDGNACTMDTCNAVLGCQAGFASAACDDKNQCTKGDACYQGVCTGGAVAGCNDGNPCTSDSCDPVNGCTFAPNTVPCDDKNACTSGDVCAAGSCKPGASASCNDGNPCTTDSCNAAVGCVYANNALPCDDKNACTASDSCAAGSCKGVAKGCDDKNPCTDDSCSATGVCANIANGLACDDANPCTVSDKCAGGTCTPGKSACDDGNPCTVDTCTPTTNAVGASFVFAATCKQTASFGTTCNDGDPCTTADSCTAAGKCAGAPLCIGGTCTAPGGKAACNCSAGQTAIAQGAYTTCCTPQCTGKKCGADGCGGTCGPGCTADENCSADGQSCAPKLACYGQAPTSASCCEGRVLKHCNAPISLAVKDCKATGQYCGWSAALQDYACTNTGLTDPSGKVPFACPKAAACTPDCKDRKCGPDGCGGSCGSCGSGESCAPLTGQCSAPACGGAVPATGCVETVVSQTTAKDYTAKYASHQSFVGGKEYQACGCAGATATVNGKQVCVFSPPANPNQPFYPQPGQCTLRRCKPNADGTSSAANVVTETGCQEIFWNKATKTFGCRKPDDFPKQFPLATVGDKVGVFSDSRLTDPTALAAAAIPLPSCAAVAATCSAPVKKVCGEDSNGQSCGTCKAGEACKADGTACIKVDCGSKVCGTDAAGNSCGTCPLGQTCTFEGSCTVCDAPQAGLCSPTGVTYCTDQGKLTMACTQAQCIGALPPGKGSGNVVPACTSAPSGRCDADCKPAAEWDYTPASPPTCKCDASCVAAGNCCRNFDAKCSEAQLKASCGNKKCETAYGENGVTCAQDCPPDQLCSNNNVLAAPYPQQIEAAGTPGATAKLYATPATDVRPRPPTIPRDGLVAYVPERGVNAGSPRAGLAERAEPEPGVAGAPANIVATAKGIDGNGFAIGGNADTPLDKPERGAVRLQHDGTLRRKAGYADGTNGGFTLAAWVKVPGESVALPNVLGTSQDLGYGNWDSSAQGKCSSQHPNWGMQCAEQGSRPGHIEVCAQSRPGEGMLALRCERLYDNANSFGKNENPYGKAEVIDDVEAYWGDAGTEAVPNEFAKDTCDEWRKIKRTFRCFDPKAAERIRDYCRGKTSCDPPASVVGANPCKGISGATPRLLVRAMCRAAPAGLSLYVEGQGQSAACSTADCPEDKPDRRLALHVPVGRFKMNVNDNTANKFRPLRLRSGAAVPSDSWFHVAVTFQPDRISRSQSKTSDILGVDHNPETGVFALYLNGAEVAAEFGYAPPVTGWLWGRGYLDGVAGNWPNKWGSQLTAADVNQSPINATAMAAYDDLFAYERALTRDEVRQLVNRPTGGALRVWPSVPPSAMARDNLWTTGGNVTAVPVELPWLRDPGRCTVAGASGLVRAEFDAVQLSTGAVAELPADGSDLDGLKTWSMLAWLRPAALPAAGQTLLEVRQGTTVRLRLASSSACGGRGVKATFADGATLELPNCDHVLAPGGWAHVSVTQHETQRTLLLDGAARTVGPGTGPLFDGAVGKRSVVLTSAADLGFASLERAALDRFGAASRRTTGPAVWLPGKLVQAGGVAKPVDFGGFHNTTASGPADMPTAHGADGTELTSAAADWSYLHVPLRGRLAGDVAGSAPPLTVAATITMPTGDGNFSTPLLQAVVGGVIQHQARLDCSGATSTTVVADGTSSFGLPKFKNVSNVNRTCQVVVAARDATGAVKRYTSLPRSESAFLQPGLPVNLSKELRLALALHVSGPAVWFSGWDASLGAGDTFAVTAGSATDLAPAAIGNGLFLYRGTAPMQSSDFRVWYGAGQPDNLAAALAQSCSDPSIKATCNGQNRVCEDLASSSGVVSGSCGSCKPGFGGIAGKCVQQREPMQPCTSGAQCTSGICNAYQHCGWSEAALCKTDCLKSGMGCIALSALNGSGWTCSGCATDFKVDGVNHSKVSGYDGLPACKWTPTQKPTEACERDTQCTSALCGSLVEQQYGMSKSNGFLVDDNFKGANWTCGTTAEKVCGVKNLVDSTVGVCVDPTGKTCESQNRQQLAVSGKTYDGKDLPASVCGECLTDMLGDKPVFRKVRQLLEPKACEKALATYQSTVDYHGTVVHQYPAKQDWGNPASMFGAGCASQLAAAGYGSVAMYCNGVTCQPFSTTFGKAVTLLKGTHDAQLEEMYITGSALLRRGHRIGNTVYAPKAAQTPKGLSNLPDLSQCQFLAAAGDVLEAPIRLPVLGFLLNVAVPSAMTGLTKDHIKNIEAAGIGSGVFKAMALPDPGQKLDPNALRFSDCLLKDYKYTYTKVLNQGNPFWSEPEPLTSRFYDRLQNPWKCVYNRQPNGTTCPYKVTDDYNAANSLCESHFCAYDSGQCEEGVARVEETSSNATNKSSGKLSDDIGAFRFIGSNTATLRFGKFPVQNIFGSIGLPAPAPTDDQIAAPAEGEVKDSRHLQARGEIKATIYVPFPKGFSGAFSQTIDSSGNAVKVSTPFTGNPPGSWEFPWNIADVDLGYVIVPGHKKAHKKVRYAPKLELLGISLISESVRPSEGDPCTGTAQACGVYDNSKPGVLKCKNLKWDNNGSLSCPGDQVCNQTSTGPKCENKPALQAIKIGCANQVKDGQYVPPSSAANKCTVAKETPQAAGSSDNKVAVPTSTGMDVLDIKFPTLGGDCTAENQIIAATKSGGPKPVWTQGLGAGSTGQITECLEKPTKAGKNTCLKALVNKFSSVPGAPPTKVCARASPVWIGPLPLTFEMEAAPVLRFKAGFMVDDTTFEPAVYVRPSLGLEITAVAKFDLQEIVGIKPVMAKLKAKAPAVASFIEKFASIVTAEAGVEGELAIVEVGFPCTWSVAMVQGTRSGTVAGVTKNGATLVKDAPILDMWSLVAKFKVDLELTLLRLSLKLFYKLGVSFLPMSPQIAKEIEMFSFSGFIFNWTLKESELARWKVDFDWPGLQY